MSCAATLPYRLLSSLARMKCPRCGATIRAWRVLHDLRLRAAPEREPTDDELMGDGPFDDLACRSGQCPTCFAYCSQLLGGQRANTYPVSITVDNIPGLVENLCM